MPLVTVAIPTYNRRDFLPLALDSVFQQSFKDFEVLVIDDGSTDGTEEVVRSYPHPVRYLRQENQGEPATRNRLIAETRTPLLAWLDSDDVWLPEKLEKQVAALGDPSSRTLVYSPKISIDAAGAILRRQGRPTYSGRITPQVFCEAFILTSSVLMPTALAREAGGFDVRYPVAGDLRLWLILSLTCDFVPCTEPLCLHRRHGANLSARSVSKLSTKVAILEEFYFKLGGQAVIPRPLAMRRLARECRRTAACARREGDRAATRAWAAKSLGYHITPRAALAWLRARLGL
jgi:glycosyltransferase involved in cell wall biosynthesis